MGTPNPAFIFPPPPPPPRATASSPGYPTYAQPAYPQDNGYASRGSHGGGGYRGRGRGDGHRARGNYNQRGRGGSPNHNQSGYYAPGGYQAQGPYPPVANAGYGQSGYAQPGQQWPQHTEPSQTQMGPQYYPPSPQAQPPQYQQPASQPPQPYYPQPHRASLHPSFAHQPSYVPSPQQPPYNPAPQQTPYPNAYPQPWQPPPPQQGWQPPIQHFQHPLPFGNPNHQPVAAPNIHSNPNYIDYTQSPRKRGGAFPRPRHSAPRSKAPPAVPSFLALPPKPPPQVSLDGRGPPKAQRPKKKRKFNTLGLTPKKEEHEDTEEEDVDEEAAVGQTLGQKDLSAATADWFVSLERLSIAYGDKQVILKSDEDIQKWIEERKKRYPTKARVEEKKAESKRTVEEAAAARKRASRKAKEKRRKEREKQQAREDLEKRRKDKKERTAKNLAVFLEKKARQAKEAQEALENVETAAKDLPDTSKKRKREDRQDENDTPVEDNANEASTTTLSGHSSGADLDMSDGDTGESMSISSGSSSNTSSSSDSSDSDSDQPEESSSRHKGPIRVPAPKRERKSTQVCRQFRSHGSCFRGEQCRFIHDIPGPGDGNVYKSKNAINRERKKEKKRKGIYQALLESEKERENLLVLEAIRFLGERGALGTNEGSSDDSDGGGRERDTPGVKQENVDNGSASENRDEKGLSDLDGRFGKRDGHEKKHIKKEDGEEDYTEGDGEKENDGRDMTTKLEEDNTSVNEQHLNEGENKDDLVTEEGKEHSKDNQRDSYDDGKEEAQE